VTLPTGWVETTFANIATQRSGNGTLIKGKLSKAPGNGLYPAFSASGQDVWRDAYEYEGDAIIVSAVGARCGKAFRASGQWSAVANTHVVLPEKTAVDPDWLYLTLNNEGFWEKGGTAQPFVKVRATFERTFLLPPLAEQRRIVAKLDTLTARLRRARTELDRVAAMAKAMRKMAMRLVFAPLGTSCRDDQQLDPAIDGRTLPIYSLPGEWEWKAVSRVCQVSGGLTKNSARKSTPLQVPYLRVANVYTNELRLNEFSTIGCTNAELQKTQLLADDILVVEGNGSLDQVGRAAIWHNEVPNCSHQNHIIRLRPCEGIMPEFVLYWFMSPEGRARIERLAASTSGLHTLSISKIAGMPIPLPTRQRRQEIVEYLQTAFARAGRLEAEAARARALLNRLEAAILARAFRGELVPQDPTDEPATALLNRIRETRAATPKPKRGRRAMAEADSNLYRE
jgi:type I restriction enzyme, S subunit